MAKWNRLLLITASIGLLAACGNGDGETVDDSGEVVEPAEETEEDADMDMDDDGDEAE
ncbi:hypothetical protein ADIAL_1338 [Alkalibacterium sp. AK22]|uniref:hypothetical protein n=1 Tax=Alkalibacterium sp. AK22 TaxID=1229520 RepID=UPI000448F994|nr:hypothetical protein [Alkalibacterium sp. AK22]EXJ23191.1 hypothetical protein ADIAL_1338 [Alkalibacterium sp. AK22]